MTSSTPFNRLVRLPNATTPSLVGTDAPLDAGTMAILANNEAWLAQQLACRIVATHPGLTGIFRSTLDTAVSPMPVTGVNWDADDQHTLALGTFAVFRYGTNPWPDLVFRARWSAPATFKVYGNLWVTPPAPPLRAPWPGAVSVQRSASYVDALGDHAPYSTLSTTSTAMSDMILVVPLPPLVSDTDAVGPDPANTGGGLAGTLTEDIQVQIVSAWAGFACTSNNKDITGQVLGITLGFEPPRG